MMDALTASWALFTGPTPSTAVTSPSTLPGVAARGLRVVEQLEDELSVLIIRPEGVGPAEPIMPTDQAASCHS